MKAVEFCYWLQGFFEITDGHGVNRDEPLSINQIKTIRNHLALVFKHEIDPSYGMNAVEAKAIHDGKPTSRPDDGIVRC